MSDQNPTISCPKCRKDVDPQVEFCPSCGYQYPNQPAIDVQAITDQSQRLAAHFKETSRIAAGSINFIYPEVEPAYHYQPGNTTRSKSKMTMLAVGIATGIAGGPLLYLMVYLLGAMGATLLSNRAFCYGIVAIALYLVVALPVGFLLGYAVSQTAIKTSCRNVRVAQVISLVSAVVCFVSFVLFYILILGTAEAFDSFIDFIKLVAYLLTLSIGAWTNSKSDIEKTPFCDHCQQYMKAIHWGDKVNKGWPIGYEEKLMKIFEQGQYEELPSLELIAQAGWFSRVFATFWYCQNCEENGILDLYTLQIRRRFENNKETSEQHVRLIFSKSLTPEAILRLRTISEKIMLPAKVKY